MSSKKRSYRWVYYAGLAALTAVEIIEWPVAVVLAVGHVLANNHTNAAVNELGEALEEAG